MIPGKKTYITGGGAILLLTGSMLLGDKMPEAVQNNLTEIVMGLIAAAIMALRAAVARKPQE